MRLQGTEVERLADGIRDAFSLAELRRALRTRLNRRLDDIAIADDYITVTFAVVEAAERGDWIPDLVAAAHELRPANPIFQAFAQQVGAGARVAEATDAGQQEVDTVGLERMVVKGIGIIDIVEFRTRMSAVEPTVCRVEIPTSGGDTFGTGFLVAKDLVMTNYHVAAPLIPNSYAARAGITADPSQVSLRFDYKRLSDTRVINPGHIAMLASEFLYDVSPPTDAEIGGSDQGPDPKSDQLDYAIFRTAQPIGSQGIGPNADSTDPMRGWIPLSDPQQEPASGHPIIIVQHPESAPMQFAIDTNGVLGTNDNGTRIRYRTNTLGGSSGSPCFDHHWNLVALHHFGDPNFWFWHKASYNQGVPLRAIHHLLENRGKDAEVSQVPSGRTETT